MSEETRQAEARSKTGRRDEPQTDEPISELEKQLDGYPTRPEGEQDPRWALNVFWIWTVFALSAIVFMTALIVLGFWYD